MPQKIMIEDKEALLYKNEQGQAEVKFTINKLNIYFKQLDPNNTKAIDVNFQFGDEGEMLNRYEPSQNPYSAIFDILDYFKFESRIFHFLYDMIDLASASTEKVSLWGDGGSYELWLVGKEFINFNDDGDGLSILNARDALPFINILYQLTNYTWNFKELQENAEFRKKHQEIITNEVIFQNMFKRVIEEKTVRY